jgi:hypothetical protein
MSSVFDLLLATLLLAAAAHLAITVADRPASPWVGVVSAVSVLLVFIAAWRQGVGLSFALALGSVVLVASLATAYLVHRAEERNAENVKASIHELNAFTGYPAERILHLWAVSNQELAKNWQQAAIAPDDQERLKEWYRQNSELYLFALSGYNLEYKRIRSNLNMLKRARGRVSTTGPATASFCWKPRARTVPSITMWKVKPCGLPGRGPRSVIWPFNSSPPKLHWRLLRNRMASTSFSLLMFWNICLTFRENLIS